jgi:3-hydroxyacyl-CoA dehydrogenase
MSNVLPTLSNATEISPQMRAMMEAGDRGVTNHRGFYEYTDEDVKKWEDCFRRTVWKVRKWNEELAMGDE